MTTFPTAEDYVRAVQRPDLTFRTPALAAAEFERHALFGIPVPASGMSAVVFKAKVAGTDQALRFFVREDASSRERYTAIDRHVAGHRLRTCVARTTWLDDAIEVNKRTWPMVQMEWVDGRTLDSYVGHLAERGDIGALRTLAGLWRGQVERLQDGQFAHGDLQHGNVLVDANSTLRLVDFDGSWISEFDGADPPSENGHPNYQRSGRIWGRWMDTFPGLVIYLGLLTLSRRPDAWQRFQNGENIVFAQRDFVPPFRTPTWDFVRGVGDPEIDVVARRLQACCTCEQTSEVSLESLLGPEQVVAPGPVPPPVVAPDAAWWERAAIETTGSDGSAMPPPPPRTGNPGGATPAPAGVPAAPWTGPPGPTTPAPTAPGPVAPGGPWWVGAAAPSPGAAPPPPDVGGVSGPTVLRAAAVALGVGLLVTLIAVTVVHSGGVVAVDGLVGAFIAFVVALPLLHRKRR